VSGHRAWELNNQSGVILTCTKNG